MMKKIFAFIVLVFLLIPLVSKITYASDAQPDVTVTLVSVFDEGNIVPSTPFTAPFGSTLTIDSPDHATYFFAFWVVNGVVRYDLLEADDIVVTTNMNLQAVYSQSGTNAVLFMDSNGKLINIQIIADNGSAIDPSLSVTLPDKPGLVVAAPKWKTPGGNTSLDNIVSDMVFILQYQVDNVNTFDLTVDGSLEGTYGYNDIATVTAAATNGLTNFSYWKDAVTGNRLSYSLEYSFTMVKDLSIEAYYNGTVTEMPLVSMSDDLSLRSGYTTYMGQFYIPDTYELIEYGFLFSDNVDAIQRSDAGVTIAQNSIYDDLTNEYVMSFPEDTHYAARAYLVAKEIATGDIITVHSNNIVRHIVIDLFFSEYIEGSGYNKALEIYNPTDLTVDLSNYSIELYADGSTTPIVLSLSGSLAAGDVFVVADASSSLPGIIANVDLSTTSSGISFTGNDAVVLRHGTRIVDSIGSVGDDPITYWGNSGIYTQDMTLVRDPSVYHGRVDATSSFNPNDEWIGYVQDTTTDLGSHTLDPYVVTDSHIAFSDTPEILGTHGEFINQGYIHYDPLAGVTVIDDTDSYVDIVVTITDNGNGDADVTSTAVSDLPAGVYTVHYSATNSLSNTFTITITLEIMVGD